MKKSVYALVAAASIVTAAGSTPSYAAVAIPVPAPVPAPLPAPGGGGGAGGAGVIIGIAAFLVTYDIVRRTSCTGDFLKLGGPGFSSPITPAMNVLPVQCGTTDPEIVRAKF